jgi:hypothetical protein
MSEHNLREMYEYVNDVLKRADPEEIAGPINWGDLKCTDVVMSVSVHGDIWIRVDIEEADPSSIELREYVSERLMAKFPDIEFEVCPEW